MLKKERWIVYPLLMLSLLSSLVGVGVIRAQQEILDRVVTRELIVVNEENEEVLSVVPNDNGGILLFSGNMKDQDCLIVHVGDRILGTSLSLMNGKNSFEVGVNEQYGFSRLILNQKNVNSYFLVDEEGSKLVLGNPTNQSAVNLSSKSENSRLVMNDLANQSVATMIVNNEGTGLILGQEGTGTALVANRQTAGLMIDSPGTSIANAELTAGGLKVRGLTSTAQYKGDGINYSGYLPFQLPSNTKLGF